MKNSDFSLKKAEIFIDAISEYSITVKAPFYDEMLARVKGIVALDDIDYVVSNHVLNHSSFTPLPSSFGMAQYKTVLSIYFLAFLCTRIHR